MKRIVLVLINLIVTVASKTCLFSPFERTTVEFGCIVKEFNGFALDEHCLTSDTIL